MADPTQTTEVPATISALLDKATGDRIEIERLRDLLKRWLKLDGDKDDIAELIAETYAEVKLLHD